MWQKQERKDFYLPKASVCLGAKDVVLSLFKRNFHIQETEHQVFSLVNSISSWRQYFPLGRNVKFNIVLVYIKYFYFILHFALFYRNCSYHNLRAGCIVAGSGQFYSKCISILIQISQTTLRLSGTTSPSGKISMEIKIKISGKDFGGK